MYVRIGGRNNKDKDLRYIEETKRAEKGDKKSNGLTILSVVEVEEC
jgi:hypothetical protein